MWQEAEDIIRSMNPIMLPDPLAVPEVGLGEDMVCCVYSQDLSLQNA
jgi:hypothetical protein